MSKILKASTFRFSKDSTVTMLLEGFGYNLILDSLSVTTFIEFIPLQSLYLGLR